VRVSAYTRTLIGVPASSVPDDAGISKQGEECAVLRIDLRKHEDVRDSALLAVLLQTGRRASEVAGLRWRHVTVHRELVTLFFARCKGNTSAHDELSEEASIVLLRWLHTHYGPDLAKLSGEMPLFVSLARGCDPRTRKPSYG